MNENLATSDAPAADKVRPRETTQQGELVSKRGKHIDIGGHIRYPYDTMAVMMPSRGTDDPKHPRPLSNAPARPLSGRDSFIGESPKHGKFGNTWQHGSI